MSVWPGFQRSHQHVGKNCKIQPQINYVEVKFVWQISFPPENGASQGNYFSGKNVISVYPKKIFHPILFCQSWDNWGQNLLQTDRQTNSLTHTRRVVDLFFKLNLLPPHLLHSQGDTQIFFYFKMSTSRLL